MIREITPGQAGWKLRQSFPHRVWETDAGKLYRFPPHQPERLFVTSDATPVHR